MPCYHWKGIDLKGSIHKGTHYFRSENHLEQELLLKNIGLIEYKERTNYFKKRIPAKVKEYFVEHMLTLLKSQIRLHQSIELCSQSIAHQEFKEIVNDVGSTVLEGKPLYKALEMYPHAFDHLMVSIISVGEQSSNLVNAFQQLAIHEKQVKELKAKIKAALFMPGLTLALFIIIMTSFFVLIVPRFASFFKSFKAPIPKMTQLILSLSAYCRSSSLSHLVIIMIISFIFIKIFKLSYFRNMREWFLFHVPCIRELALMIFKLRFLQILSLSLSSGMHLLGCLHLSYNSMRNSYIRKNIKQIIDNIENGVSLSTAVNKSILEDAETIALIKIGESSGNIDQMIMKALDLYQKKFYLKIDRLSSLIHPAVLLILGVLISLSIFSVYVPILTLTSFIH